MDMVWVMVYMVLRLVMMSAVRMLWLVVSWRVAAMLVMVPCLVSEHRY
jgi:hypothetical protein